jgi:hypothetical protein
MPLQTTKLISFRKCILSCGRDDTKEVKISYETFGSWAKGIVRRSHILIPVQKSQIDFVDMPNAVQSEISVVNTVNLLTNNILLLS